MKKLTTSVLAVVLTSTFTVVSAQQGKKDTLETTNIGEVVITGALGVQKKFDAQTSSAALIKKETLTQARNQNAVQSLTGKVAGLQINQSNSSVTGSYNIQIRDAKTVTGSTSPLVVIDGVRSSLTILQQIPSDLIESTTILKGSQGAALYGSDGVNGAILVTTVKGSGNKSRVNVTLNSNVDFDDVAFTPYRQKIYGQGWDGLRIHVENGSWGPKFDGSTVAIGLPKYDANGDGTLTYATDGSVPVQDEAAMVHGTYSPRKNNVREFFQMGTLYNNGLTISTGGKEGYISLGINRADREFVVADDTNKKTTILVKGGFDKEKWALDASAIVTDQITRTTNSQIYRNLLQSSTEIPITQYRNLTDQGYAWTVYYQNPYWNIKHERNNSKLNTFVTTASLTYKLNDHIKLVNTGTAQVLVGDNLNYRDLYNGALVKPTLSGVSTIGSFLNQSNSVSRYFYNDTFASFDYDLTDDLNAKLLVGFNIQDNMSKITSAGGTGLKLPGVYTIWNLTTPTQPYNLNNDRTRWRKYAVFGNLDLSYKNYLYLNVTGRNEWSSKFVNSDSVLRAQYSNYSYFYPSVGVSFMPMKAFDMSSSVLSRFVVKGSWTRVGNDPIGASAIEDTAILGNGYPYGTGPLSFVTNSNPTALDIKPEKTTSLEGNLGLGFLKDRITLDVSVYQNTTNDLITRQTTSSSSGIATKLINIGEIKNNGLEIELGATPIKTDDFRWNLRAAYSSYKQKVVELAPGQEEVALYSSGNVGVYAVKGEDFPVIKGTAYQRDSQGRIIVDAVSGDALYTNNFVFLGRANPKYILSFSTDFKYKNVGVYAVMDYRTGNKFYSAAKAGMAFSGNLEESATFDRDNGGYIIPNSVYIDSNGNSVSNTSIKTGGTDYASVVSYFGGVYSNIAENFMIDGTAFKVRELGINYSLSPANAKSIGITGLTIGLYARNAFNKFAKDNKGYGDPETSIGSNNLLGIAGSNQYPAVRTFGFSTTINF